MSLQLAEFGPLKEELTFILESDSDFQKGHISCPSSKAEVFNSTSSKYKKQMSSWQRCWEPDYYHLVLLLLLHTAGQFCLTYAMLRRLPSESLAQLSIPTSFEATQTTASLFQELILTNRAEIYALLLSAFFYFQVWLVPCTWVFALLCGTCMPSLVESGLSTHALNVLAVLCNYYMSRVFLTRLVKRNDRLRATLESIEHQVTQMGPDQVLMGMISLRVFPGSPNTIYNVLFPHLPSISLAQNLLGVAIGQLPYNLCVAKAGQVIRKIHGRAEIVDLQTSIELLIVAMLFMLPVILGQSSRKKEQDAAKDDISTEASSFFNEPFGEGDSSGSDDEESGLLVIASERRVINLRKPVLAH